LPLETATYISDLVTSNPAASDGMNNADDHMRLTKAALKNTFPSITGAVTATQGTLNGLANWYSNGVSLLASSAAAFAANPTDSFQNPGAGEIDIVLGGTLCTQFYKSSGVLNLHHKGPALFDGTITGPGVIPIGGMIMWLTDTLPVGNGTWCWANGGTLSRTGNGAALFALWGTAYGVGDGSTTFNVVNMQEVTPVGRSQMGGGTSPGLLASISDSLKAVINGLFGSGTTTLTLAQLPTGITSSGSATVSVALPNGTARFAYSNNGDLTTYSASGGGSFVSEYSPGNNWLLANGMSGSGTAATTSNNTGGAAHNIVQPSRAVNFIIRIG
jgi:microcystin-dependent protein